MNRERLFVIAYDITANRRRNRVVKLLKDYGGRRANFSVFECRLAPDVMARLKSDIKGATKPRKDTILFYDICLNCEDKSEMIGLRKIDAYEGVIKV